MSTQIDVVDNSSDDSPNFFPEKLLKKLPTGFSDDADAMSEEDLKKTIIASENNIANIEKEKENDAKLNAAKSIVQDLNTPYREAKNAQSAKIKYCIFLLKNKGILA